MLETIGLDLTNFNIVITTAGGFLLVFGLVSYGLKQRLLLSEALIAVLAGVFFSRIAFVVRPAEYTCGGWKDVKSITLEFTRLVLGVQLLLAGVQLPSRYMYKARRSLMYLLGPALCLAWIVGGLVVWAVLPNLGLARALTIAACVAPTDPVLSNAIIKGRFADRNTPKPVRDLISAESGANDGLGYPFLFLALFWIKLVEYGDQPLSMIRAWFLETWIYVIGLSVVYGLVVGLIARRLQLWSMRRSLIEEESSVLFAVALALFILGTSGMVKIDDVLACFVAGCALGLDHKFQPIAVNDLFCSSIDMLLNASIFIWYGAVAPWGEFANNNVVSLPKLILLGILVLLLRRLPVLLVLRSRIPELETTSQACFVGFFGPIGVSAIYYLMLGRNYLDGMMKYGNEKMSTDARYFEEAMWIIVWFLVMSSVVVHGIALPIGKIFRRLFPDVYKRYFRMNALNDKDVNGGILGQAAVTRRAHGDAVPVYSQPDMPGYGTL